MPPAALPCWPIRRAYPACDIGAVIRPAGRWVSTASKCAIPTPSIAATLAPAPQVDALITYFAELARAHGLLVTGGSDYHGTAKPGIAAGQRRLTWAEWKCWPNAAAGSHPLSEERNAHAIHRARPGLKSAKRADQQCAPVAAC